MAFVCSWCNCYMANSQCKWRVCEFQCFLRVSVIKLQVHCGDADPFQFGFDRVRFGELEEKLPSRVVVRHLLSRSRRRNPKQAHRRSGSFELHDQQRIWQIHNQQKHLLKQQTQPPHQFIVGCKFSPAPMPSPSLSFRTLHTLLAALHLHLNNHPWSGE